jgi:hypothetical protein
VNPDLNPDPIVRIRNKMFGIRRTLLRKWSFFCVRSLDLMGRNLKKVEGMVNKINTRQGKDKTLGFLSKCSIPLVDNPGRNGHIRSSN